MDAAADSHDGSARADNGLIEPVLFDPLVHSDSRGFFFEAYNQEKFDRLAGHHVEFVQDNHSRSARNVLRGLHYQLEPAAQGKLVRVVHGVVYDVAVDIRRSSAGFLTWQGHELSAENRTQFWVPPGYAHGFLVLSEWAEILYKTTAYYAPALDRSLRWDDPDIGIAWPLGDTPPVLSAKDAAAPGVLGAELFD
ncbi:MAG: dTDP-4-dehydrorhamnose 3,5-epimerase [Acidimicrobiia bacterium]